MKLLKCVHVIQFSFWDFETFLIEPDSTGIIGANGAGKTTLIDAIQIAMVGASKAHMHFNAQSVQKDERLLKDYALGAMRSADGAKQRNIVARKRDEALSYITLVFESEDGADVLSAGVCIHSLAAEREHRIVGLYVLPGVQLDQEDHLESMGGHGRAPIDWVQFESLVQLKAKAAGIRPTITTKPELYQAELLHNIQDPARPISRSQFMRALKHSINLKHVESVNDFLRKYLVEASSIEKQGTLAHIKLMRELAKSIENVKSEIGLLQTIERAYEQVKKWYRQRANVIAVRLSLQAESEDARIAALDEAIEQLKEKLFVDKEELIKSRKLALELDTEVASLIRIEATDPDIARALRNDKLHALTQQNFETNKRAILRIETRIRHAMGSISAELARQRHPSSPAASALAKEIEARAAGGLIAMQSFVADSLAKLTEHRTVVHAYWDDARRAADHAKEQFDRANARASAARRGIQYDPRGNVGMAMALFQSEGIECATVASLVEMTNVDWQGAVEAFLGRNREALVVKTGREREAVRLLRSASRPLYGVTVVQPKHLESDLQRGYDATSVANLIRGNQPVALAFLRRMLGSLRQVQSEQELEVHSRALTVDGMLSSNGGTTRLELLAPGMWLIGVHVSNDELRRLDEDVTAASAGLTKARNVRDTLKAIIEEIDAAVTASAMEEYGEALERMNASVLEISSTLDDATSARVQELTSRLETANLARKDAGEKIERLNGDIGRDEHKIVEQSAALKTARDRLADLDGQVEKSHEALEFDADLAASYYDECQEKVKESGAAVAMAFLANLETQAETKIRSNEPQAKAEFLNYLTNRPIVLREELNDWRLSLKWVSVQRDRLLNSTLIEYEEQANDARLAAERAFQADIKFKLREAIRRVQQEIKDLNSILDVCPEFTGGERYAFVADPDEEHKGLYDLILSDQESGQLSISDEANVVGLLEACETGALKGCNPLEDYRLLFSFDLKISVNGQEVDRLSKRMGVASNGEHRVPFYVIAGASLAAAYRIKSGAKHRGAGIMLVDEAFYGMDAQNSFVTAEFLKSLGLQLVLAGPDTDVGKLIPVLDSYYDIFRPGNGPHAHFSHIVVKPNAKRLLQSDIPEMHPHLVEQQILKLEQSNGRNG